MVILREGRAIDKGEGILCPVCEAVMVRRTSRFGIFYGCSNYPACDATHGAHQDNGRPLGVPADKKTREARVAAHEAFDSWRANRMSRSAAYRWLAKQLNIPQRDCHIGRFDLETCRRVVTIIGDHEP